MNIGLCPQKGKDYCLTYLLSKTYIAVYSVRIKARRVTRRGVDGARMGRTLVFLLIFEENKRIRYEDKYQAFRDDWSFKPGGGVRAEGAREVYRVVVR